MNSPGSDSNRRKPNTLQATGLFLDRRRFETVAFWERGTAAFGDRMRGIAYLLFLAEAHRVRRVLYHDRTTRNDEKRARYFPGTMTDMIRIDGVELLDHDLPFPDHVPMYYHYAGTGNPLMRFGFPHMHRVRPKSPLVEDRVSEIGGSGPYLAFHVRNRAAEVEGVPEVTEQEITDALKTLKSISDSAGVTRVYLSAVDASSYAHWRAILDSNGFQVIESQVRHDDALILPRRTDDTDMLVDFFAMAGALRVVRLSYSEFSRFAAWIGGRRLGARQLS